MHQPGARRVKGVAAIPSDPNAPLIHVHAIGEQLARLSDSELAARKCFAEARDEEEIRHPSGARRTAGDSQPWDRPGGHTGRQLCGR